MPQLLWQPGTPVPAFYSLHAHRKATSRANTSKAPILWAGQHQETLSKFKLCSNLAMKKWWIGKWGMRLATWGPWGAPSHPGGWLETPAAQCKGCTWQGVPGAAAAPEGTGYPWSRILEMYLHLLWAQGPLKVRLEEAEALRFSPGYLHTSSEPGSHLPVKVHSLVIQKIKSTGGPHEQCYTKPQTTSEPAKQLSCWDKLRFWACLKDAQRN